MLPRNSEDIERGEVSRLAPRFHIELRADAPNEFRPVAFRGKHPTQKKQIARLHRFHIGTERLRRHRELDAKFLQPLLGAGRPRAFAGSHLLLRMCIHVSLSLFFFNYTATTEIYTLSLHDALPISDYLRRELEERVPEARGKTAVVEDRKSTRLNSSHVSISYAVFCLKKKN